MKPYRFRTWHKARGSRNPPRSGAWRYRFGRTTSLLIIFGALAFRLWWPLERPASTIAGPARIVDGDTLEIGGERIRILDIDAPESDQHCRRPDGSVVQCGQLASGALSSLVGSQSVECELFRRDRYVRWLASCSVAGQDIARWLAKSGLAVPYRDCRCIAVGLALDELMQKVRRAPPG